MVDGMVLGDYLVAQNSGGRQAPMIAAEVILLWVI